MPIDYKKMAHKAIEDIRFYIAKAEDEKWVAASLLCEARLIRKDEFHKRYVYPNARRVHAQKMNLAHDALTLAMHYKAKAEEATYLAHMALEKLNND